MAEMRGRFPSARVTPCNEYPPRNNVKVPAPREKVCAREQEKDQTSLEKHSACNKATEQEKTELEMVVGNVRGNIKAPRMTLEDGAKFKGSIDMDPSESPKAAAKPAAKAESKAAPAEAKPASNGAGPVADKGKGDPGLSLKG